MNYYVRDMEWKGTLRFDSRKYKFDYLEPDAFSRIGKTESATVVGRIRLSVIDSETPCDKVIISEGLDDYCFRLMPLKNRKSEIPGKLLGYVMIGNGIYAAVYRKRHLLPVILILTLILIFCFHVFIN